MLIQIRYLVASCYPTCRPFWLLLLASIALGAKQIREVSDSELFMIIIAMILLETRFIFTEKRFTAYKASVAP
jgi:hypothetical protein